MGAARRSKRPAREPERTKPWWLLGFGVLVGGVCAVAAKFARLVLTPSSRPESKVEVVALEASGLEPGATRVWLTGPDADLEGSYSFIFDARDRATQHLAGHARLGPVVATEGSGRGIRVAREVISVERGEMRVGARGRITGWWFTEPEQLGYETTIVSLPLPHGVGWGWVIAPEGAVPGRWAVHVHGRGALPHETLRGVEPFAEAGYTSLVIAYRNDRGAPDGLGSRYGLGLAEQDDVDAVIGWARNQGATDVVVVGWSMGGTASVLAVGRGRNREVVRGLVLDSPALDWPGLLQQQAKLAHLPIAIAELAGLMLRLGLVRGAIADHRGTDIAELTAPKLARLIRVPTLIHASAGDTFVPWEGSLRVAQLRSSLVRLHPSRGEHVKLWNADPVGWKRETARFLAELG